MRQRERVLLVPSFCLTWQIWQIGKVLLSMSQFGDVKSFVVSFKGSDTRYIGDQSWGQITFKSPKLRVYNLTRRS